MNLHSLFESMSDSWSQKYKDSINCSHPKGFSQKAHCAGKKKHNESVEMEMVCEDCGMCETHGNLNEIKKGQKDANGYTRCWPGKHAVGTKKGKNGGQVRNCEPNEGVAEANDPNFVGFMNKALSNKVDAKPEQPKTGHDWYDNAPTHNMNTMPSYKHAFKFGMSVLQSMDPETKQHFAEADNDTLFSYLMRLAEKKGFAPKHFVEEDLFEVTGLFSEIFHDPAMQDWEWSDLLRSTLNNQGVAEGFSNDMSIEDMIAYLRQHHDTNLHQDYLDHINTFSKFVLQNIPVNSIKTDLPALDRAKVEQYKQMDFSKAPPIVIGGGYILDGYHRANVAKALGIPTIKAYVGVQGQQGVAEGYNDLGPEYGGAYVNGRSDDARMTEKLTRQAKAAAAKAGKTFSTSAEYRLWHMKQKSKKQGVAEAQTDYQKRRQRERDVNAGKPVKRQPKNPQNDYFARRKKERDLAEDQPVQLSPNISARPNQDPDSPEDWDYYYKDMHVAPGQDFHTQIKDQHLRQMDPAYNTMRAAFDNPTKPGPATPYKEPTGDTIIPSRPQAPEKMKDIEGNPVRLKDYVPGDPRISESRLYYSVIGTADKDLRSDFGLRKDNNGWYLKESSSVKYKMMAQRAFGSPKLQEYNFPAGQATKGSEGVISPVGSVPRNQINKR